MTKRMIYVIIAVVVLLPVVFVAGRNFLSARPSGLGVNEGRLAACPDSPNCVSTQADVERHAIEPVAFTGSADKAIDAIKSALERMPRTRIIEERDDYLHAEATSLLFRFVDDVEFFVNQEQGLIHFRSASRLGRSDLGVNRARIDRFRSLLEQELRNRR